MDEENPNGQNEISHRRGKRAGRSWWKRRLFLIPALSIGVLVVAGGLLFWFQPNLPWVCLQHVRGERPDTHLDGRKIWMPKWAHIRWGPDDSVPENKLWLTAVFRTPWKPWRRPSAISISNLLPLEVSSTIECVAHDKKSLGTLGSSSESIRTRILSTNQGDVVVSRGLDYNTLTIFVSIPDRPVRVLFQGCPSAMRVLAKFLKKNDFPEELQSLLEDHWLLTDDQGPRQ